MIKKQSSRKFHIYHFLGLTSVNSPKCCEKAQVLCVWFNFTWSSIFISISCFLPPRFVLQRNRSTLTGWSDATVSSQWIMNVSILSTSSWNSWAPAIRKETYITVLGISASLSFFVLLEISFFLSKEDDTEIKHWLGGLIMTVFTININQKIKSFFFLTVSLFIRIVFFFFSINGFFFLKNKSYFLILYLFFIGLFYFHDTNLTLTG